MFLFFHTSPYFSNTSFFTLDSCYSFPLPIPILPTIFPTFPFLPFSRFLVWWWCILSHPMTQYPLPP